MRVRVDSVQGVEASDPLAKIGRDHWKKYDTVVSFLNNTGRLLDLEYL